MRKFVAICIALALLLCCAALGEAEYRIAKENEKPFAALLNALVRAYEDPSPGDGEKIEVAVRAIASTDEDDGEIAQSIAEHWKRVFLDDYRLLVYAGGADAPELEDAGIPYTADHAFVVLGYELKDGAMTAELQGRCDAAAAAARAFPDALIVCSGGATGDNNPAGNTEAGLMRDYFVERCGIDPSRIRVDERAMTTAENALNTFAILEANGVRSMTIVTSTYHQRWGQAVYNAVGALVRQAHGYDVEIVGNYCFDIEPSRDLYRRGEQLAAKQIASILGLPRDALG